MLTGLPPIVATRDGDFAEEEGEGLVRGATPMVGMVDLEPEKLILVVTVDEEEVADGDRRGIVLRDVNLPGAIIRIGD